ncbi:hypothetical protein B0H16DRAFT_1469772 [Mycena metata]|uniref:Uncharacterized protein n=1 Tax=Mycena metata TaxID=1033252 RepID=A0AAD7HWH1_9AGAR|nr:hypothetical protein B0H16DRAFT_1469772 [Mycena metata]
MSHRRTSDIREGLEPICNAGAGRRAPNPPSLDARHVGEPPIVNARRRNSGRQWQTVAARWGYKHDVEDKVVSSDAPTVPSQKFKNSEFAKMQKRRPRASSHIHRNDLPQSLSPGVEGDAGGDAGGGSRRDKVATSHRQHIENDVADEGKKSMKIVPARRRLRMQAVPNAHIRMNHTAVSISPMFETREDGSPMERSATSAEPNAHESSRGGHDSIGRRKKKRRKEGQKKKNPAEGNFYFGQICKGRPVRESGQRRWTMPMKKTCGVVETSWTRCLPPQTACLLAPKNSACVKSKVPWERPVRTRKNKDTE